MEIDAEILAHYAEGQEHGRLTSGPSLELLRTRVLLERFLPAPPARVLDVGGAGGVHASWLSGRGYQVHLIDPVPLHLEQAMAAAGSPSPPVTPAAWPRATAATMPSCCSARYIT